MTDLLWQPSIKRIEQSSMWLFLHYVQDNFDHRVIDYPSLYLWSIEHPETFWPAVWRFCNIKASRLWDSVANDRTLKDSSFKDNDLKNNALKTGGHFFHTQWFSGSKLNFTENLLRYCHDEKMKDQPAIIFRGEDKIKRTLTYTQLYEQVARLTASLKNTGIEKGDRVAGFLPNIPEAIIAMLATSSLGAVWSSCSPDFGYQGVLDRFGQIEPTVLFTADGYFFKGKTIDSLTTVKRLTDSLATIKHVIVVPYIDAQPDISNLSNSTAYDDFLTKGATPTLEFLPCPFNHPLYIMYSSGTTGTPKCIVHGAGGTLIQHLKELVLHTDIKPGDRLFYFTTCGWMMWNWLISGLAAGACIMLYEGSPFHPKPDTLMDFIQQDKINIFGTSAKYLSALEKAGIKPIQSHDLSSLRTILSTGSPLAPESYDYVYTQFKTDVQLSSISGGTDIISCFALGNPILPVYKGELQSRGLGMHLDVFNAKGQAVRGEKGELVCLSPFPSMPVKFWNDPGDAKYHAAYFEKFTNVWAHGDYAELTVHDGLIIYGRSDAVLNPGGVRIGTAEIYRQVEKLPEILESIAIGQQWQHDERIILFVKLREPLQLDEALIASIKHIIRQNTTPRHVPEKIIQVVDIPHTISGKIVELAVRDVVHNKTVKNTDALANPEALAYFKSLPELET